MPGNNQADKSKEPKRQFCVPNQVGNGAQTALKLAKNLSKGSVRNLTVF